MIPKFSDSSKEDKRKVEWDGIDKINSNYFYFW